MGGLPENLQFDRLFQGVYSSFLATLLLNRKEPSMNETLQILEKLNSFYSGAFTQLITYTIGVLAFVGIIIPGAISFLQSRQFKRDQKAHLEVIATEIDAAKVALLKELGEKIAETSTAFDARFSSLQKEIEAEVMRIEYLSLARTFHLQSIADDDTFKHGYGLDSAFSAANYYALGNDEANLMRAIVCISSALSKSTKESLECVELVEDAMKEVIGRLQKLNSTGRYKDVISEMRRDFTRARERTATTT
jgi:hypothetical protein